MTVEDALLSENGCQWCSQCSVGGHSGKTDIRAGSTLHMSLDPPSICRQHTPQSRWGSGLAGRRRKLGSEGEEWGWVGCERVWHMPDPILPLQPPCPFSLLGPLPDTEQSRRLMVRGFKYPPSKKPPKLPPPPGHGTLLFSLAAPAREDRTRVRLSLRLVV